MTFNGYLNCIASPALRAIAAHWDEARAGRNMPSWEDLRPAAIASHLTKIWAMKFDPATREFTMRLAGERIARGFNRNFRGLPLASLHPPEFFPAVYANDLKLVEGPCLAHLRGRLFRCRGRYGVGERISLPLSSDGIRCDGIVGASEHDFLTLEGDSERVELLFDEERHFPLHAFARAAA